MATGLEHNGDVAGLLDGIAAQVAPPQDAALALLATLRVARLQADKLTGHNIAWTIDVQNALNDLIEGVEGEVLIL